MCCINQWDYKHPISWCSDFVKLHDSDRKHNIAACCLAKPNGITPHHMLYPVMVTPKDTISHYILKVTEKWLIDVSCKTPSSVGMKITQDQNISTEISAWNQYCFLLVTTSIMLHSTQQKEQTTSVCRNHHAHRFHSSLLLVYIHQLTLLNSYPEPSTCPSCTVLF